MKMNEVSHFEIFNVCVHITLLIVSLPTNGVSFAVNVTAPVAGSIVAVPLLCFGCINSVDVILDPGSTIIPLVVEVPLAGIPAMVVSGF